MTGWVQYARWRKNALQRIIDLDHQSNSTLIIHYSCESFYNRVDGKTSRITSIAVKNIASGQTQSFSIHKIAEEENVPFSDIDLHYDDLEKKMLDNFFEFVRAHQKFNWIHWRMRDINYGFAAIEHRYRVLSGTPVEIQDDRKFDLSNILKDIYGADYVDDPQMTSLIDKNNIYKKDFLKGEEEAEAFENKEYVKLHQSTLRKVDAFFCIYRRALDNTLQTDLTWRKQYGYSITNALILLCDSKLMKIAGAAAVILTIWSFFK